MRYDLMRTAEKQFQTAIHALNQRQFYDAERRFRRVLSDYPSHVGALNLLTITLMKMDRLAEAEPVIARAVKLDQSSDVSFYNYGLILKRLGKPKQALEQFSRALRLNQSVADTWNNRGTALNDLSHYEAALADFDKAIALNPSDPAAYANKGRSLAGLQRYDEAIAAYDRALKLNPRLADAWLGRGAVLALRDRYDDAFAAFQQALAINPNLALAHSGVGNTLWELGRLDEAREAYRKALAIDPTCGEFHYHYANTKKITADDSQLAAMEALGADDAASPVDRMYVHFALGKAYADIGEHARAFAHWQSGNALKRQQIDYDEASMAACFDEIEAIFTPALIADKSGQGDPSTLPIFVLGMPRSGTTLVEQILASHPAVYGAGELNAFGAVAGPTAGADGKPAAYPQFVPALDGPALKAIGARYAAELRRLAAGASRVTDKMPGNFMFAGMIHLALPNAKIIHTVRDPVDTCLSCFSNLFFGAQDFSYDLGELGRYYARYRRLMTHWHRVLPPGRILDVRYEDVVADLEGQARRLIEHCGLPWDARCLAFNESTRPVRTASATQVRQPIYGHSTGRWRAYEKWLGPLLRELDLTADPK
jgi:tetratricopeptide (TPR) repeat protein